MTRFANGSSPTGDYRARLEYDAGYRDGYRAAQERAKAEFAVMRAQHEELIRSVAAAHMAAPITVQVDVETAARLLKDFKHEGK